MNFLGLREVATGNDVLVNPGQIVSVSVRKNDAGGPVRSVLTLDIEKPSGTVVRYIPIDGKGVETPEESRVSEALDAFHAFVFGFLGD